MGALLNESGDMLPPDDLYEACRVMGKYVNHLGDNRWDFSELQGMQPDPVFVYLVNRYLKACALAARSRVAGSCLRPR